MYYGPDLGNYTHLSMRIIYLHAYSGVQPYSLGLGL